jgi:hypothetical protein
MSSTKKEIADKILKILGIVESGYTFNANDVENNNTNYTQILELEEEIKKIFPEYNTWTCYKYSKIKYKHTLMIKSIFQECGFKVISKHYYNPYNIVYSVYYH